jgi:hypothetical protein
MKLRREHPEELLEPGFFPAQVVALGGNARELFFPLAEVGPVERSARVHHKHRLLFLESLAGFLYGIERSGASSLKGAEAFSRQRDFRLDFVICEAGGTVSQ